MKRHKIMIICICILILAAAAAVWKLSRTSADLSIEPDHLYMLVSLDGEEDEYYEALTLLCNGKKISPEKAVWHSDDPEIAEVDPDGWVTSMGVGITTVSAAYKGASAKCTVTVTQKITSDTQGVISDIPENSVLLFKDDEGAAKLVRDMREGRIPTECRAMYDAMGTRPEVVLTDPEEITELYNRFGQMLIGGRANESITDNYHYIIFTLQDGTTVGWHFEGTGLLNYGMENYEVISTGSVWDMVRDMQGM